MVTQLTNKLTFQLFPEIGGEMTKNLDHYKDIPKQIYVVATEKMHRMYSAEGHALNFFAKQADAGLHPIIIVYTPTDQKKGQ